MRVSANQMIHFQMALPPPKQRLNPPAERINKGDFFGRQVLSICSDPVDFASNAQADEIDRVTHSVVFISHPDLPEEKDAVALYDLSLVNTENLATTEFDPQLAVVFDIRCRSTKGNEKSPNVSQDRVNWTSTMADRILPVGNGGVLGSSKSMSKMRVNPYRDRAKSFYQRYVKPTCV